MFDKIFSAYAAEAAEGGRDAQAAEHRNRDARAAEAAATDAPDRNSEAAATDAHDDGVVPNVHVRGVPIFCVRDVLCRIRVPK